MKKISDLKEEKMRLRIRQLELEKELRTSWKDMKQSLRPSTFLKNKLFDINGSEEKKGGHFTTLINHGAAFLTRQLVSAAGNKIANRMQTGIENLAYKLKGVSGKKK